MQNNKKEKMKSDAPIENGEMIMKAYKFRAEILSDVDKLRLFLSAAGFQCSLIITKEELSSDFEVVLEAGIPLTRLKHLMGIVEDNQLMMETVNYEEHYTGIRISEKE